MDAKTATATSAENLHKEAERIRGMTDMELVKKFDDNGVKRLIREMEAGKCKGIGGGTVYKVTEFAKKLSLI